MLLGFYIVTVNGDGTTKVLKEKEHIAFLIMILIPGVTLSSQQFVNILKVIKDILKLTNQNKEITQIEKSYISKIMFKWLAIL